MIMAARVFAGLCPAKEWDAPSGLDTLKCRHGALPRAVNRTPFQGYNKKEIPAFAGMTEEGRE